VQIDIIWDIAAAKADLLLEQLEPLLPAAPDAPPDAPRSNSTDATPSRPADTDEPSTEASG
jgi:hypothetical protein